jgi:hypothetical protein
MGVAGRDKFIEENGINPHDAGRIAFWQGRPAYANPGFGATADEWREGWRGAAAQLLKRASLPADTDVTALLASRPSVLETFRPGDVPVRKREGVHHANRVRRAPFGKPVPVAAR